MNHGDQPKQVLLVRKNAKMIKRIKVVLCNINLCAIEVARFMALFLHYPDSSTSSLSLSEVEGSMSFCGLKPIGAGEFFTSSHDLKVVAINCDNYLTLNLCYNPVVI
jgi:hypothetical protein